MSEKTPLMTGPQGQPPMGQQPAYPPPATYPPPGAPPSYPPPGQYPTPGQPVPPAGAGMAVVGDFTALAGVERFAIKQQFSLLEAVTNAAGMSCCEAKNRYDVYDANTGMRLFAAEEDSHWFKRCCCNPHHELTLRIKNPDTKLELAHIKRPFKWGCCPAFCDMCLDEATLYRGPAPEEFDQVTGPAVGSVKQPTCGGWFTPTMFSYMGPAPEEVSEVNALGKIEGPTCCFGGCTELCFDQEFKVTDSNGADTALIVKEKPRDAMSAVKEIANDADMFTLTMKKQMTGEEKMVLLSSVLLVDYMFFEEGGMVACEDGKLVIRCCQMYCCGCLVPCNCVLGGNSDNSN